MSSGQTRQGESQQYPWIANYPAGVAWDMLIKPEALPVVLEQAAKAFATHPAIGFMWILILQ